MLFKIDQVKVEQRYVNREADPIEAVYVFPIEEEAAVVDFVAEVEGRIVRTEVRKKEEARTLYQEAIEDLVNK